jgi:hypothetical protein
MNKSPSFPPAFDRLRRTDLGLAGLLLVSRALAAEPAPGPDPELFFQDSFAYPAGALAGANGGLGASQAYQNKPALDPILVESGSLSYPNLQSTGNKLRFQPGQTWGVNGHRSIHPLGHRMVWGSFLLKINQIAPEARDDGFELTLGAANNVDHGFSISVDGPELVTRLNIRDSTRGPVGDSDTRLAPGSTYLIVFQYNASSSVLEDMEPGALALYLNPPLGTPPALRDARIVCTSFLSPEFGTLAFFARHCDAEVDELRLGATFAAVTPLITPAAPGAFLEVAALLAPPRPRVSPASSSASPTPPSS